jgi:DNA mismatch repair protein MutL
VNIHPAKAEVRFSDEKIIFSSVYFAVKNALMESGLIYEFQIGNDNKKNLDYRKPFEQESFEQIKLGEKKTPKKPEAEIQQKPEATAALEEKTQDLPKEEDKPSLAASKTAYGESSRIAFLNPPRIIEAEKTSEETSEETLGGFSYINQNSLKKAEKPEETHKILPEEPDKPEKITVIGELFKNYIIAQSGEKMIIIDKHAAHERIIFERLRSSNSNRDSQMLIEASRTLLSAAEFEAVKTNNQLLENMGFSFDYSGEPYIKTIAVPVVLAGLNVDEVVLETAENLALNKMDPQTHKLDDLLHDMACKAAIKANDKNNQQELQKLAEDVFYNENIRHCPHGRPVMFVLSKRDIEKQFRRIV